MARQTAIAAALERADVNTGPARLYALASKLLGEKKGNVAATRRAFAAAVVDDAELLLALADDYLTNRVAADMSGAALAEGRAQPTVDTQCRVALSSAPPSAGGGGQGFVDTHGEGATPPAETDTETRGGGHLPVDAQARGAADPRTDRDDDNAQGGVDTQSPRSPSSSRPHRDGAGQTANDAHGLFARPAREPSVPKRGLAVEAAINRRLYGDFAIQGHRFADIRVPSLDRLIFSAGREKVALRCAKAVVARQAHVPDDAKLGDVITDETFGKIIAFAKHASLHGIEYMNDAVLIEQMEAFDA